MRALRVLITSIGTATSIGLIKAFRRWAPDAWIIGTDTNNLGFTAGSMLVDEFHLVPPAVGSRYTDVVIDLAQSCEVDLLVPIHDAEIAEIATSIARLPKDCKCHVPSPYTVKVVRDKMQATKLAASLGIPCPKDVGIDSMDHRIVRDRVGVGSNGVHLLASGESVPHDLEALVSSGRAFVQEYLPGSEFTVDVLSDEEGVPICTVPRERLEVKAGVATKVRIVEDGVLDELARLIVGKLHIPGFANVQFKEDKDGTPRFIEVNPRFGGCTAATIAAVPDFFTCYLDVVKDSLDRSHDYLAGAKWGAIVTRYFAEMVYEPC